MPVLANIAGFCLVGITIFSFIRITLQTADGLTELKLYEMQLEKEEHERYVKNAKDEGINEERERNAKEKQDLLDKIALLENKKDI